PSLPSVGLRPFADLIGQSAPGAPDGCFHIVFVPDAIGPVPCSSPPKAALAPVVQFASGVARAGAHFGPGVTTVVLAVSGVAGVALAGLWLRRCSPADPPPARIVPHSLRPRSGDWVDPKMLVQILEVVLLNPPAKN